MRTRRDTKGRPTARMSAMKRLILVIVSFVAWTLVPVSTQTPSQTPAAVPELQFESVPDPLSLPPDIHFGEIAGVANNSKGHIFVFSRGNVSGPAYMTQGCRSRARCSASMDSPAATSASSDGSTRSRARQRTKSGWAN